MTLQNFATGMIACVRLSHRDTRCCATLTVQVAGGVESSTALVIVERLKRTKSTKGRLAISPRHTEFGPLEESAKQRPALSERHSALVFCSAHKAKPDPSGQVPAYHVELPARASPLI
jgi:hypothetical protein